MDHKWTAKMDQFYIAIVNKSPHPAPTPVPKGPCYDGCAMDYTKIITIDPDKRSGKPCIRGTRMTVTDVLEYLAGGMTPEELVVEFPDLTLEDIRACLAFAADRE